MIWVTQLLIAGRWNLYDLESDETATYIGSVDFSTQGDSYAPQTPPRRRIFSCMAAVPG